MEPFRWWRALFLGVVSYAASLAGLVFDTFVPVLLPAGYPLWHNSTGLHAPPGGFALAPSQGSRRQTAGEMGLQEPLA
jgi:hypothetical protein